MRWIFISPHLDDAVLSCGGLIYEQAGQGEPVEIWTIFAGEPPEGSLSGFALWNYAVWGLTTSEGVVAMRRAEDVAAAKIVGARLVHFDFLDCIYRRSPKGEFLYTETVMTSPRPEERNLPRHIAAALQKRLRPDDVLLGPLALGGHVDHILVRRAAQALHRPLWYYADVPYILKNPETLDPATRDLESQHYPMSETGLGAWLEGVAAYQSQLDSLFNGPEPLQAAIRSYWSAERGIRLWRAS